MEIQVSELKKTFGNKIAIDIPSLSVTSGELVGIVGNNGAGKTTLFRLMLDLLKADSGTVTSNGLEVNKNEKWKEYTGSFIDTGFLIEFLTPEEFFYFVGKTYNLDRAGIDKRLLSFDRFMNHEILGQHKYIRHFSAGNKQKIGIIAAMMVQPAVLILDEPFNFLDPSSQMIIKELIRKMNEEHGTTVFLSSHNLTHTTDIASRMLLLEKGVILKDLPNTSAETVAELNVYFNQA